MSVCVFNRVEEKYLLTPEKKEEFLNKVKDKIKKDLYFESKICSIYFDTKDNDLIINSLDKPIFKEKVRIRSYGIPKLKDKIFLEVKTKYNGVTGKRREELTLKEFYNFLDNRKNLNSQIMKEISYIFDYYNLVPKVFIGYDRNSYIGINEDNLRITFDSNIRSRSEDLKLELGDAGNKLFKDDKYIMEIKTNGSFPIWLVNVLSELEIYPVSFSKYGNIYKQIENKKEGYLYA